jgi:hypothetical protein
MSKTIPIQSANAISPEPWVDIKKVAEHLGFGYQATAKMVKQGKIPGKPIVNGKKTYWRFRLSIVDAFMQDSGDSQGASH